MTKFVKNSEIKSDWYEIDANNAVVGRLATIISKIIRGKNKTTYTPHMDHGDFVVVKNIALIPEDVARAAVPPSSDATLSSNTATVGFEILLYI